jgi:hypothetical protein
MCIVGLLSNAFNAERLIEFGPQMSQISCSLMRLAATLARHLSRFADDQFRNTNAKIIIQH